jgi:hypothetical protein
MSVYCGPHPDPWTWYRIQKFILIKCDCGWGCTIDIQYISVCSHSEFLVILSLFCTNKIVTDSSCFWALRSKTVPLNVLMKFPCLLLK